MKKQILKLIIASILTVVALLISSYNNYIAIALFITALLIAGGEVIFKAIKNIIKGRVFDESFLMSVATIGAFFIGEYAEGVAVMVFYLVGEIFQDYAVDNSRKSISSLMDIRPDYANIIDSQGSIIKKEPSEVNIGDTIIIKAGERVPLDSVVIKGESSLDVSALTGESMPKTVYQNVEILSGSINLEGIIYAEVIKTFEESTVSKILELVENASNKKSRSEKFITKFARIYTPIVVIIALLLAVIPPFIFKQNFNIWIYRALSFLVVSCPCALVVSIPLSFFSGIGTASKMGVLIKGSNYIDMLAKIKHVVFDKTGTLTKGTFKVIDISPEGISKEELLRLTAHAESLSTHPISLSLKNAYNKDLDLSIVSDVKEIAGKGITAQVEDKIVYVGNSRLMESLGIELNKQLANSGILYVAIDNKYSGYFLIADEIKKDSKKAIQNLKALNIDVSILTGDTKSAAKEVATKLLVDNVYWGLLPQDKVEKMEEFLSQKPSGSTVTFVGDGINDAPVLSRADVGIAMGGLGSDSAIEASDVIIMTDESSKISTAIKLSKRTLKIAKQNIVFSISIKIIILILSMLGFATMWDAVFADVGVTILAILNSFRVTNTKKLS